MTLEDLCKRASDARAYASRSSSWWSSADDRRAAERAAVEAEQAYFDALPKATTT